MATRNKTKHVLTSMNAAMLMLVAQMKIVPTRPDHLLVRARLDLQQMRQAKIVKMSTNVLLIRMHVMHWRFAQTVPDHILVPAKLVSRATASSARIRMSVRITLAIQEPAAQTRLDHFRASAKTGILEMELRVRSSEIH